MLFPSSNFFLCLFKKPEQLKPKQINEPNKQQYKCMIISKYSMIQLSQKDTNMIKDKLKSYFLS